MDGVYLAGDIQTDSIVDGEGIRAVIWFQGCSHNCAGCHNPDTHPFNVGEYKTVDEVKKQIDALEGQDGITFSGGDPMFQPQELLSLIKYAKYKGYNTWIYSGFLIDNLFDMDDIYQEILKFTDVLVDGKFEVENRTFSSKFRGSSNQRVIDVQKTLVNKEVVLYYEDEKNITQI